jgi:predicted nucleic acid-binding protein
MLYLDSSALMKRYVAEKGSGALNARFERGEHIYTSVLSFGEIHAALAQAYRLKRLTAEGLRLSRDAFLNDWLIGLSAIEVNVQTMTALPGLVENYLLRAADAIHLSAMIWLRDTLHLEGHRPAHQDELEFGVADLRLGEAASKCGFRLFNPESFD